MLAPSDRAENSHGTNTTRPKSMGAIMLIIQIIRTTTARVASMHAIILTVMGMKTKRAAVGLVVGGEMC